MADLVGKIKAVGSISEKQFKRIPTYTFSQQAKMRKIVQETNISESNCDSKTLYENTSLLFKISLLPLSKKMRERET